MEIVIYGALCPEGEERALARRLLVLALERECGVSGLPEMAAAEGGKPYFPARPKLQFNLSHSRGAAVCALHHLPIGVDVERLRPAPQKLSRRMGCAGDEAFFRLWTAKEATIKRQGRTLGALLSPLEPDPACRCFMDFLPGWVVTVCPSEEGDIRAVRIEEEMNPS